VVHGGKIQQIRVWIYNTAGQVMVTDHIFLYRHLLIAPCRRQKMPYHWKKKVDVDETIVVIRNVLDRNAELPNWLVNTIYGAIRDSDPAMAKYFYGEVKKYVPTAMKYFQEGSVREPI
jgi:hypothetical protein